MATNLKILDKALIVNALQSLIDGIPNKHNDPIKSAAFDYAKIATMFSFLEDKKDACRKTLLESMNGQAHNLGEEHVLLADKGISVTMRINKGAARLDRRALPAAIINAGWCSASGQPLLMNEINSVLDSATSIGAPSTVIKATVSSSGN